MMATNDRPVVAGFSLRFASPAAAIRRLKPATTNPPPAPRRSSPCLRLIRGDSRDSRANLPSPFTIPNSPSPATA